MKQNKLKETKNIYTKLKKSTHKTMMLKLHMKEGRIVHVAKLLSEALGKNKDIRKHKKNR